MVPPSAAYNSLAPASGTPTASVARPAVCKAARRVALTAGRSVEIGTAQNSKRTAARPAPTILVPEDTPSPRRTPPSRSGTKSGLIHRQSKPLRPLAPCWDQGTTNCDDAQPHDAASVADDGARHERPAGRCERECEGRSSRRQHPLRGGRGQGLLDCRPDCALRAREEGGQQPLPGHQERVRRRVPQGQARAAHRRQPRPRPRPGHGDRSAGRRSGLPCALVLGRARGAGRAGHRGRGRAV
eukprot:scaffold42078_cov56-Phaeocystis_antarctica.AAC.2